MTIIKDMIGYEPNLGPYYVKDGAIWIQTSGPAEMVCSHDIYISKYCYNNRTQTSQVEVVFYSPSKRDYVKIIVDWDALATGQNLIRSLGHAGAEVNSENAKGIVRYLSQYKILNSKDIKQQTYIDQFGWYDGAFIPYNDNNGIGFNRNGFGSEIADMYDGLTQPQGSRELSYAIIGEMRKSGPLAARIAIAAAFASPLLKLYGALPYIVSASGKTSTGKTLLIMLAMSIYGNPEALMSDMSATDVGKETYLGVMGNLPAAFDETQLLKAKDGYKNVNMDDLVYRLSQGKSKTKGNLSSTIEATRKWCNTIYITGEDPIANDLSAGGVLSRIISLQCKLNMFGNSAAANELAEDVKHNYGWIGPAYIDAINDGDIVNEMQAARRQLAVDMEHHGIAQKQAATASVILIADMIAADILFDGNPSITMAEIETCLVSDSTISKEQRAHEDFKQFVASGGGVKLEPGNPRQIGIVKDDMVCIMVSAVKEFCTAAGVSYATYKSYLQDNGIIATYDDGKITHNVRLNPNASPKCYIFRVSELDV